MEEEPLKANRRSTLKVLGGTALTAAALPALPLTAMALEDYYVSATHQNHKRGTIQSLEPATRGFTIIWQDFGRLNMKAADLVTNYGALRVGQIVDVTWFDYVDCLIAPTTPAVTARAEAMIGQGARIDGISGARERIRLWSMIGMCTKADPAANTVFLVNTSGGAPGKPLPDRGEVVPLPQIVSEQGKASLKMIKPGMQITAIYSVPTAFNVTIFSLW